MAAWRFAVFDGFSGPVRAIFTCASSPYIFVPSSSNISAVNLNSIHFVCASFISILDLRRFVHAACWALVKRDARLKRVEQLVGDAKYKERKVRERTIERVYNA
jgi:hypothetical protein